MASKTKVPQRTPRARRQPASVKLSALISQAVDKRARRAWFGVALYRKVPMQRHLLALLNDYEEARRTQDRAARSRHRAAFMRMLDRFERQNGAGHPNPEWAVVTMRALAARAFGKYSSYLQLAKQALQLSRPEPRPAGNDARRRAVGTPSVANWQEAVSRHNIADAHLSLGRPRAAIRSSLCAIALDTTNAGFWALLAEATFRAGQFAQTREILYAVPSMFGVGPDSVVGLCVFRDPVFRQMAAHREVGAAARALHARVRLECFRTRGTQRRLR